MRGREMAALSTSADGCAGRLRSSQHTFAAGGCGVTSADRTQHRVCYKIKLRNDVTVKSISSCSYSIQCVYYTFNTFTSWLKVKVCFFCCVKDISFNTDSWCAQHTHFVSSFFLNNPPHKTFSFSYQDLFNNLFLIQSSFWEKHTTIKKILEATHRIYLFIFTELLNINLKSWKTKWLWLHCKNSNCISIKEKHLYYINNVILRDTFLSELWQKKVWSHLPYLYRLFECIVVTIFLINF